MSTFESFKSAFKGDIVTPSDVDYDKALKRWAKNAERPAKYVAFVKDAEDIKLALEFAKAEKLPIAIRGGGHNAAGASSKEGGLIIDLSRHLAGVTIDPVKKLGYAGGGAIWETVDKAAIEHGLATVGGTVNHVLTLGGGYGWLSGEHGLTIDNLVQATVVVANGTILTANKTENSDLFWAIRGGGCNFGVVTEFVFQLHDQRRTVYAGTLIFPAALIKSVMQAANDWWDKGPSKKEAVAVVLTRGPPPERYPCVICSLFFNGSEEEGREIYKPFFDLNPVDHTSEIPYENMNALMNHVVHPGQSVYLKGAKFSAIQPDQATDVLEKIAELTTDGNFRFACILEMVPTAVVNSVPGNATAMPNRTFQKNVLLMCLWDDNTPENQKAGKEKVYIIGNLFTNFSEEKDLVKQGAYSNYVDEYLGNKHSALLFGDNYPKLQQLKRKYDPEVIFNTWFPIVPA
ncbi:FAD-binding domain-containing protein [Fomitiporia mediterranea MF3/22]|uniref:FAD-binding domain-containing protein n=1 Tax=Fomitiporia mediterranea (strain MF3/22) TaxID=694068 RepID=UPI00044078EC|nr:FAD-binding domain-containing protein [Fomitiporia mediterranea MF3/22]EJD01261.1 FAD-binding domain-containing protein [Fomitiporia mediterranea MF3/22]